SILLRSSDFTGLSGMAPPWYQAAFIPDLQLLAGISKCISSLTGVTSGLKGSPLASAVVGRSASSGFQAKSIVWLPISPICPLPKSQYMFHWRQFAPEPPEKYSGLYGCSGEGPSHRSQWKPSGGVPFAGRHPGLGIW